MNSVRKWWPSRKDRYTRMFICSWSPNVRRAIRLNNYVIQSARDHFVIQAFRNTRYQKLYVLKRTVIRKYIFYNTCKQPRHLEAILLSVQKRKQNAGIVRNKTLIWNGCHFKKKWMYLWLEKIEKLELCFFYWCCFSKRKQHQ